MSTFYEQKTDVIAFLCYLPFNVNGHPGRNNERVKSEIDSYSNWIN
jgi:hypothetical protein